MCPPLSFQSWPPQGPGVLAAALIQDSSWPLCDQGQVPNLQGPLQFVGCQCGKHPKSRSCWAVGSRQLLELTRDGLYCRGWSSWPSSWHRRAPEASSSPEGVADLATPSAPVAPEKKSRFLWLLSQAGAAHFAYRQSCERPRTRLLRGFSQTQG